MFENKKEEKMLAKTLFGLEDVLADELSQLGAKNIVKGNRAVEFSGDLELLYKANLHLRTALRVLVPLHNFVAKTAEDLYEGVMKIKWADFLSIKGSLIIKPVVNSKYFTNSIFVAQKAKDAIIDQLRDEAGNRPSISKDSPDLVIDVHISNEQVIISLDSTGAPLNRRGYRRSGGDAPLNEVLAAGMILMSKWDKKSPFIDAMCGSGTLLIEAALMATNTAPNLLRKEFTFMRWANYDKSLWTQIRTDAQNAQVILTKKQQKIIGSDMSMGKLEIAQDNIRRAGFSRLISLRNKEFDNFIPPKGGGMLIINPPYGERLKVKQIEQLYTTIGNSLKYYWKDYQVWILSSNVDALKNIGLKSEANIKLLNGKLECKYQKFTIFEGKRVDYLKDKNNNL